MDLQDKKVSTAHDLLELLKGWGLEFENHEHEPIFTVEEGRHLVEKIPGIHTKNLFLKTKKDEYFLVVMQGHDTLDLKAFTKAMGVSKLSFASAERLKERLGLTPGSVTPFGLVHPNSKGIAVILDAEMMDHDILNYHPLRNDMTTSIGRDDFIKFIEKTGHEPKVMALPKQLH